MSSIALGLYIYKYIIERIGSVRGQDNGIRFNEIEMGIRPIINFIYL